MSEYKTPGVYVVEKDAFPNSVVEVPTAVPAFIGFTQKAMRGTSSLLNTPTRITSFAEFEILFGIAPTLSVVADANDASTFLRDGIFILHQSMKFFYDNGGGPCYIVSIGDYSTASPTSDMFTAGIDTLTAEQEPTMVVTPETCLMGLSDWSKVAQHALLHCQTMQSRVAVLDLWHGNYGLGPLVAPADAPVSNFRSNIGTVGLNYGCAYYPWLNTSILEQPAVTFMNLSDDLRKTLSEAVTKEQTAIYAAKAGAPDVPADLSGYLKDVKDGTASPTGHAALMTVSPLYKQYMVAALAAVNVMPPSAGMAGVITRTDNTSGVWQAPANTSMMDVVSPCVNITHDQQEDLNMPLNGLAVNAIRSFINRGVLVWGARTLDGNSQDWRYISVRRTLIMLEQSAKAACDAYVFAPNDAGTWSTVKAMLENFLTNQWKAGALAGTKPADAFSVDVGLNATMTGNDILDGYMRVTIKVAVTHPAEFIVLTFQQQMQKS